MYSNHLNTEYTGTKIPKRLDNIYNIFDPRTRKIAMDRYIADLKRYDETHVKSNQKFLRKLTITEHHVLDTFKKPTTVPKTRMEWFSSNIPSDLKNRLLTPTDMSRSEMRSYTSRFMLKTKWLHWKWRNIMARSHYNIDTYHKHFQKKQMMAWTDCIVRENAEYIDMNNIDILYVANDKTEIEIVKNGIRTEKYTPNIPTVRLFAESRRLRFTFNLYKNKHVRISCVTQNICNNIPFTVNILRLFEDYVDWYTLSLNKALTKDVIETFKDKPWVWSYLINVDLSREIIIQKIDTIYHIPRRFLTDEICEVTMSRISNLDFGKMCDSTKVSFKMCMKILNSNPSFGCNKVNPNKEDITIQDFKDVYMIYMDSKNKYRSRSSIQFHNLKFMELYMKRKDIFAAIPFDDACATFDDYEWERLSQTLDLDFIFRHWNAHSKFIVCADFRTGEITLEQINHKLSWLTDAISCRCDMNMSIVLKYPDVNWDWDELSMNPNFTEKIKKEYSNFPWREVKFNPSWSIQEAKDNNCKYDSFCLSGMRYKFSSNVVGKLFGSNGRFYLPHIEKNINSFLFMPIQNRF